MHRQDENEDRQLDANLRRIGEALKLPDLPEQFNTARAISPLTVSPSRLRQGVRYMKNHRMMAIFGAGSALAAAVAIAVSLVGFGTQNRVEAAAIFQSWREAVSRAFSLRLNNIKHDGFTVDGRVMMALPAQTPGAEPDPTQVKAYVDLHIEADETADDMAGLNTDIALGAETGNEWIYIKMTGMPAEFNEEPIAAAFAGMTRNGMVLDLNGMLLNNVFSPMAFIDRQESTEADAAPTHRLNIGVQIGNGEPETENVAPHGEHHLQILNMGGHVQVSHDQPAQSTGDDNGAPASNQPESDNPNHHDLTVVSDWFQGLFDGTLTSEQMAAMVTHIESAAREVRVDPLPEGGFSLIAKNFNHDGNGLDADDQSILEQLEVEIRYAEATGVQWVELRNLGDGPGSIRFEQLPNGIDPALLDRSQYTAGGTVPTLPLSGLINLFHGNGAGSDEGGDDATPSGDASHP